jgi:rubrerythrin
VQEILEFAVYIEERGYEFYIGAIKKFREARITKLFQYLADEEFKHEKVFKKLLKQSGEIKGRRDPEYQAYMREFCKTHSLGDAEAVNAKLARVSSLKEILDMAMDFEKDSVIFFSQLKEMYARGNTAPVEKIIHEEMGHLRKIFQIKKELVKE